jgi:hypothetical protein
LFPKMPDAKRNHLFFPLGTETATSMAPLMKQICGWIRLFWIFLTNYGFHLSSPYGTPSRDTDYVGVSEAAGLLPQRSVTACIILAITYEITQVEAEAKEEIYETYLATKAHPAQT